MQSSNLKLTLLQSSFTNCLEVFEVLRVATNVHEEVDRFADEKDLEGGRIVYICNHG